MKITRAWCRKFLTLTGSVFALGTAVYGVLWYAGQFYASSFSSLSSVPVGLAGGWLLASITAGVLMFARWIRGRKAVLKILCGVLFPLTLCVLCMAGMFGALPMTVYCIVYLHKHKNEPEHDTVPPPIYYPPINPLPAPFEKPSEDL